MKMQSERKVQLHSIGKESRAPRPVMCCHGDAENGKRNGSHPTSLRSCDRTGRASSASSSVMEDEAVLEAMAARVAAHQEKLKLRNQLCEHPFRTTRRSVASGAAWSSAGSGTSTSCSLVAP